MRKLILLFVLFFVDVAQCDDLAQAAPIVVNIYQESPDRLAIGDKNYDWPGAKAGFQSQSASSKVDDAVLIICDMSVPIEMIIRVNALVRSTHKQVFVVARNSDHSPPYILITTESFANTKIIRQLTSSDASPEVIWLPMQDTTGLWVDTPPRS